jgi:hypothetical protein
MGSLRLLFDENLSEITGGAQVFMGGGGPGGVQCVCEGGRTAAWWAWGIASLVHNVQMGGILSP